MKLIEEKAAMTYANDGLCAYNAEVTFIETDEMENAKKLFIHSYISEAETHYTLAEKSMYDYMTNNTEDVEETTFIEEYEDIEETKNSKYSKYFELADKLIEDLINN